MIRNMKWMFGIICALCMSTANAVDLRGSASLNITSDTAATAKNMAMAEARRQIISDVLGQYSDRSALTTVLGATGNDALNPLIASTEIDGEQTSDTTYSAKITMTIDDAVARTWMAENSIQNWLPSGDDANRFVVWAEMKSPMENWIELNQIVGRENINVAIRNVQGNRIMIDLPMVSRGAFTIAVRESGWHYTNMDGALRIWK